MDSDAVLEEKSPLGSLSGFTIIFCHGVVLYMKEMELQNQNLPSLFFFLTFPFDRPNYGGISWLVGAFS